MTPFDEKQPPLLPESLVKMAAELPKVIEEINALVKKISDRMACLPPDFLLYQAWWDYAYIKLNSGEKLAADIDGSLAISILAYLQNVIVSRPLKKIFNEVSRDNWNALKEDVKSLFICLSKKYLDCKTADRLVKDSTVDLIVENFRKKAELLWLYVRGKRYSAHESQALLDILMPHSEILSQLFGIDAPTFVGELEKILKKHTFWRKNHFTDLKQIISRAEQVSEETDITDFNALLNRVFEDKSLFSQMQTIEGELFGLDLFNVEKITRLPKELLKELAWAAGEEKTFFEPGEFCGWPTRIQPITMRPFIQLDDQFFCFEIYSLYDNIYRVLQRTIKKLAPLYEEKWNSKQKTITENLPLDFFKKILPDAEIFPSIYYRCKTADKKMNWCETDGIVIFEDHLFIIEIKANKFASSSPNTKLDAHLDSLCTLVNEPIEQGVRFLDYLESGTNEIPIFNKDKKEIYRLKRSCFRHIIICAVTLDPLMGIAASAQYLPKTNTNRVAWVFSIDDLRVYADFFDNPLQFLHFIEQRILAASSNVLELNSEMDHLGFYLAENQYKQYADDKAKRNNFNKLSVNEKYRAPIDEYYDTLFLGSPIAMPQQEMPPRYAEVIKFLNKSKIIGRAELTSIFLNVEKEFRLNFSVIVEKIIEENEKLHKTLSVNGNTNLTIYFWPFGVIREIIENAIFYTRCVMILNNEKKRPLIEFEYNADGFLENIYWQYVTLDGLSESDINELKSSAEILSRQRAV